MLKHRQINTDTGAVIAGRHAKIASVYTRGAVRVRYTGRKVETDCKGSISLPVLMREPGKLDDETERLSWAYLNHEMGHIDVDRRLATDRGKGVTARCSRAIYQTVPEWLAPHAIQPGDAAVLYSEILDVRAHRAASAIAHAYCDGLPSRRAVQATTSQLMRTLNHIEDPRMEAGVARRWKGAGRHLEHGLAHDLAEWKKQGEILRRSGQDKSFGAFLVSLTFRLHGVEPDFMGPNALKQLGAISDLVELFLLKADWRTHHGLADSYNLTLSILDRIYECATHDDDSPDGTQSPSPTDELRPGMEIVIKATGRRARILQVHADGSIDAEHIEGE